MSGEAQPLQHVVHCCLQLHNNTPFFADDHADPSVDRVALVRGARCEYHSFSPVVGRIRNIFHSLQPHQYRAVILASWASNYSRGPGRSQIQVHKFINVKHTKLQVNPPRCGRDTRAEPSGRLVIPSSATLTFPDRDAQFDSPPHLSVQSNIR